MEIKEIDIEWLKKHSRFSGESLRHYNTKEYVKLKDSIIKNGLLKPIELEVKNNMPYISNGNHRLQILDNLGYKRVPVQIFAEDDITICGKCKGKKKLGICRCPVRLKVLENR